MKQTMGMSIAVMALLGHASAIDVEKHHSQQSKFNNIENKEKAFIELEDDDEENDAFMAESIREAEAEYKKNKAGTDVNREIFRQAAEDGANLEASQEKQQSVAPELKKTTDQMTQDMIDGALNSKSIMSVTGTGDVSVSTRDVEKEAKETADLNKQAIHQALQEVTTEIDSTNKVVKKETPPVVAATDKDKDAKKEADKKKETKPAVAATPAVSTPVTPVVAVQKKQTPDAVAPPVATTVTTPSSTTTPVSTTISIPVGDLAQKKKVETPIGVIPTQDTPKTPFVKVAKTTDTDLAGTKPDLAAAHISTAQISKKKSKKHHHKQEESSSDSSSDSDSGDEQKSSKHSAAQKPNVIKQFIQEFTDVTPSGPKDNTKLQTKQISLSEQEDKDIQESIAFAEQSTGQKLELNRKIPGKLFEGVPSGRIDSSMISSLIESETAEGDCDIKDFECQQAFHSSLNLGQKKKEGPSIGLLALAEKEDSKAKAEPAKPAAEAPKAAPVAAAPKADVPVKAVAVGDLNETPVPNGPHTTKTVQNGNSTTAAIVTQPFVIGNGPAAISTTATPSYPSTTGKLGYAQINAPTAVAVGDLKVTPVPNGAHTSKIVDNGNATTSAIVTQPFYIGNSVASESTAKTPNYPVASKDQLGYAQVTTPGSIGPPGIVPTGAHTSGDTVIGNHTTDAFTTQKRYIGTAPPAISPDSTPSYPSPVKLGYNQTATKAQALAEESHSDSDSGSESDQEKEFVDPKNFVQTKVQHPKASVNGVTFF